MPDHRPAANGRKCYYRAPNAWHHDAMAKIETPDTEERRPLVQQGIDSGPGLDADVVFARLRARFARPPVHAAAQAGLSDIAAGRYTLVATPEDGRRLDERLMARLRERLAAEE